MPRSLFGRLFLHSVLALVGFVATAGLLGGRFLDGWETRRAVRDLERVAWAAAPRFRGLEGPSLGSATKDLAARTGLRVTVIGPDGTVLADSHGTPAVLGNLAGRPEVRAALDGGVGQAVRRSASIGEPLVYVAVPGDPIVRLSHRLDALETLQRELWRRLGLASGVGLVVALGLAAGFSRTTARRIRAMTRFAARAGAGDLEEPLAAQGADELADLERALDDLRAALGEELRRLRAERTRLGSLLVHLPDGILVLGRDDRIRITNPAARRILRLESPGQDLTGTEVLRHPELQAALEACRARPDHARDPVAVDWPDPPCRLLVRFVPLPDEAGILVVLRDVTRQHELERMRRDFVANLAHELRTPLTAIRGAAETLPEAVDEAPETALRFAEAIRRNARRLEALLGDASDLARIEAGASPVQPERLDARTPVRAVVEMFSAEAGRRGVALEALLPEEPVEADLDPEKVESILINLVQNAVRYTPQGGRARVRVEAGEERVAFVVEDTGIGIPPSEIPRVTERFYRVDPGRSRATGGTGLGLAIVKHLTELLGGTLRIEPRDPQGTRVTVELPRFHIPQRD